MSSFIEKCARGEALLDEIDDYVGLWHKGGTGLLLHKFLGMTKNEYSLWVRDPHVLPFIVTARKENRNISELLEEFHALPMAARSAGPQMAAKLMNWLKREGLWQ